MKYSEERKIVVSEWPLQSSIFILNINEYLCGDVKHAGYPRRNNDMSELVNKLLIIPNLLPSARNIENNVPKPGQNISYRECLTAAISVHNRCYLKDSLHYHIHCFLT